MMSNTLLIHIGMMKTGTTALQKYLFENADVLESHGWIYPILDSNTASDKKFNDIRERGGNGHFLYGASQIIDTKSRNWNHGWEIILSDLKHKNVILSSELITIEDPEIFLKCALEKYNNIKVLIYLRRQDRWIESCYNENVKTNHLFGGIKEYIDSEKKAHYLQQLDLISRIVGKENLIVRVYEKQQLVNKDIVADFLSVLAIQTENEFQDKCFINPSLRGNYFQIKRFINSIYGAKEYFEESANMFNWDMDVDFANVCWSLSRSIHQEKGEFGFFTPEERQEFLEKYTLENEQIAREYLHREDGVLFYDNRMDYPLYETGQYNSSEADIIRVFSTMLYYQNWKFQEMLNNIQKDILITMLMKDINQSLHNRKLLFFGAGFKCRELLGMLRDASVELIVDNDIQKDGTVLNMVTVHRVDSITDWHEYFVVVTCTQSEEIEKQLCRYGLKKGNDYIVVREYGL